jgi:enterochelin esterase-like enzyme
MASLKGELVTENLEYDGGREITVYVPPDPPEAVVFAGDGGWHITRLSEALESAASLRTMIVGVHGLDDDEGRFKEYVPGVDTDRFAEHEKFFVEDVRGWVKRRFGVDLPPHRTAVWGASLGGEFSLAIGHRHPDVYGATFCASPGGGYKPDGELPSSIPRTYFVAGTEEQWFVENAARWADALREAGADTVMMERPGEHGGSFWFEEFPLMVEWAFGA